MLTAGTWTVGKLLGKRVKPETFKDKASGQSRTVNRNYLGIEETYIDGYGEQRVTAREVLIPDDIAQNANFLNDFEQCKNKFIAVPVFAGYQKLVLNANGGNFVVLEDTQGSKKTAA